MRKSFVSVVCGDRDRCDARGASRRWTALMARRQPIPGAPFHLSLAGADWRSNLPRRHVHKLVGNAFHQRRLVCHHENRLTLIANPSQHRSHVARRTHIDIGERLIQQDQFRTVQDSAGQRQPLPHSLRVLADAPRKIGIEPDHAHRIAADLVVMNAVEPGEVAQILHAAELVVKQRRVAHVADAMRDLANFLRAQQSATALARLHQPGDDAQQRALPCSVVAQHDVQAPGRKAGRDAAQRGEPAKKFHQIFEDDDRRRVRVAATHSEI